MSKDTGGPAFPQPLIRQLETAGECGGMTLRDYFAAKAMQALAQNISGENWANITAYQAYQLADAMLAERAR